MLRDPWIQFNSLKYDKWAKFKIVSNDKNKQEIG